MHSYYDLKNVSVEYVDPISVNFKNHNLLELPPNGQGVTVFLIRKMLEKLGINKMDPMSPKKFI